MLWIGDVFASCSIPLYERRDACSEQNGAPACSRSGFGVWGLGFRYVCLLVRVPELNLKPQQQNVEEPHGTRSNRGSGLLGVWAAVQDFMTKQNLIQLIGRRLVKGCCMFRTLSTRRN